MRSEPGSPVEERHRVADRDDTGSAVPFETDERVFEVSRACHMGDGNGDAEPLPAVVNS